MDKKKTIASDSICIFVPKKTEGSENTNGYLQIWIQMQISNPLLIAKAARMQNCSLGLMDAVMVIEKQLLGERTYDNFPSCTYNAGIKESMM